MAKQNTTYGIGQHRFTKKEDYINSESLTDTDVTEAVKYVSPPGAVASTMDAKYRDVMIQLSDGKIFNTKRDYYLSLTIPRDIGFSHTVNVYLGKTTDSENMSASIQPIRQLFVASGGNIADNAHYVAIYADEQDGDTQGPIFINSNQIIMENGIATAIQIGENSTPYFNYTILTESWRVNQNTNGVATFEMVFRPLLPEFNCIYLVLKRTSDDYRISRVINNENYLGHVLDIDSDKGFKYELYELNPVMGTPDGSTCFPPISHNALTRIGVWSRPGLKMAINGEEISVGQSGYYELDAIPITSLSIYAQDFARDNFSIDYQYVDSKSS